MESIDVARDFHKYSYETRSIYRILNHFPLHRTRKKEDSFECNLNTFPCYQCDSCDVVTNFKILLHHHTNVVHKELEVNCDLRHILRSYECGECDFQTCSTVVLLKHFCDTAHGSLELRAKSSEQWFQCEHCQHRTRRKDNLKNHILCKHSNPESIKWFQCQHCSHKTKRKDVLKDHIRYKHTYHKDVKWFKCDNCSFRTRLRQCLRRHVVAKHTNSEDIKWFQCEKCSYRAKRKEHMRSHVAKKHTSS